MTEAEKDRLAARLSRMTFREQMDWCDDLLRHSDDDALDAFAVGAMVAAGPIRGRRPRGRARR